MSSPELGKAGRLGNFALPAPLDRLIERRRITGAIGGFEGVQIDFGHN
jgi:hypothetical protein